MRVVSKTKDGKVILTEEHYEELKKLEINKRDLFALALAFADRLRPVSSGSYKGQFIAKNIVKEADDLLEELNK